MKLRVIVAGGRDCNNYTLVKSILDQLFVNYSPEDIVIISGTARGADQLGERYAQEKGIKLERYPADWDTFGKSAGYRRNAEMADVANACVCFWDGQSKGTMHMINIAKEKGLALRVERY